MATIRDVALKAGVSIATVSRILNGENTVRPQTAARVNAAIAALHYTPNLLGRNLRQGETRKILVLLNTIANQFYSRVVKGIEECAREREYTVMVCMTHGDAALEESYLKLLKTRVVDGAVFLTVEQNGEGLTEALTGFPAVQACEPKSGFAVPCVSIDNERAGYDATRYLLEQGHTDIAFFGAGGYDSSQKREAGFRRALAERGIFPAGNWILQEGFSVNAGRRAAGRLLTGRRPSAVFCVSDSAAAGAINSFQRAGLRVPGDISVLGFDNTQISEVYLPSITTMRQPQYEIGRRAMELLFDRIDRREAPAGALLLPHQIMERESVARRAAE